MSELHVCTHKTLDKPHDCRWCLRERSAKLEAKVAEWETWHQDLAMALSLESVGQAVTRVKIKEARREGARKIAVNIRLALFPEKTIYTAAVAGVIASMKQRFDAVVGEEMKQ